MAVFLSTRSTQRQGDKRSAAADLIASNAPLRNGSHKARQNGPKHYPGDSRGPPIGAPAKAQRSGFGGERRSSGTTELLPRKAKRRMWSLRRRGTPFSPIFRRATKDGATGGRQLPSAAGKKEKQKSMAPGGLRLPNAPGKNVPPKITVYSPRTFIASPAPNTDPQTTIRFPSSIFAISIAPEKLSLQSALQ